MKKYSYRQQFKKIKEDGSLYWQNWSEELFDNKEDIEHYLIEEIKEGSKGHRGVCVVAVDYEIKEVEIKNMEIEGDVSDYGEYEDYTVLVGDTRIEDLIINKFKGQKIKMLIEVIE